MWHSYSFNLYYIEGKDKILKDFLSRQKHDESHLHEVIPISFNMQEIQHAIYYNIHEKEQKRHLICIRPQARTSNTILSKVHGEDKGVDPNIKPEQQIIKPFVPP